MILKTCSDLSQYYDTNWYNSTCLALPKTKRWRNTQKFEWMTDKIDDDDDYYDYYKVIPWIASSKSSDQKLWDLAQENLLNIKYGISGCWVFKAGIQN